MQLARRTRLTSPNLEKGRNKRKQEKAGPGKNFHLINPWSKSEREGGGNALALAVHLKNNAGWGEIRKATG